jgi:DNA-binding winged helix-turn-helix (wHTH) protein
VVEEANLQMRISKLRKLLGGEVMATVPGRGYRFVAVVGSTPRASALASVPAPGPASPAPRAAAHRLIGRDDHLAHFEALLQDGGGVTLVGTLG